MIISLHWQVNKDLCCKNVPECQFFSSIFEEGQSVSQLRTRQVVVWARQMMQWLVWLTDTVTCLCPPTKATQCHMSLRKAPALSAPGLDPFHYNRFAVKSVASLNLQSVVESGLEMAQTGSQGYDTPLGCVREWVRQPASLQPLTGPEYNRPHPPHQAGRLHQHTQRCCCCCCWTVTSILSASSGYHSTHHGGEISKFIQFIERLSPLASPLVITIFSVVK